MVVNIKNNSNIFTRTEILMTYFNDIKKYDSNMDNRELLAKYKEAKGSEKEHLRNLIVKNNQRFVVSVARVYANNSNLMDLIEEGNIGLMQAIDAFDVNFTYEGKPVKFTTFAVHYIKRAMTQYKVNNDAIVRKKNISKTYHIVAQARNKFIQENGRQPSLTELKEAINKTSKIKIKDLMDVADMTISYIDDEGEGVDSNEDRNNGTMLTFNSYTASGNLYEDKADSEFKHKMIGSLLKILTPREQKLIKMSFGIGYDREMTNIEIGEELNLTTERVRQMKKNILSRLQQTYKRKIDELI